MAEMLSPFIKSSSVRRLSLEFCQKFGSSLLSPSNNSNHKRKLSVPSCLSQLELQVQGSPAPFLTTNSFDQCASPLFLIRPIDKASSDTPHEVGNVTPVGSKSSSTSSSNSSQRRGSDSYSHNVFIKALESSPLTLKTPENGGVGRNRRRSSLTSLKNLSFGQSSNCDFPRGINSTNLSISPIPSSPSYEGCSFEPSICSDYVNGFDVEVSPEEWNQSTQPISAEKKSQITYQVFPPTPQQKDYGSNRLIESPRSGQSSDEDGKVFDSRSSSYSYNNNRRRTSAMCHGDKGRRKSSTTRYDFDQDFLKLVFCQSKLQLDPEHILGKGSFGTVVAGTYKGDPVAVKVIRTESESRKDSIRGEENGLTLPPHLNIAKVIEILQIQPTRSLVIIERLQTGNLLAIINDPDVHFNLSINIRMSSEVASALAFCHKHGILHLDVKPQNVLLHSDGSCKLSDFGNSKRISELNNSKCHVKLDGTVAYKAPELFRGKSPTAKCDVFSMAIFMWQVLTREQPYMGETEHSLIYKVVAQGLRPKSVCAFLYDINANVLHDSDLEKEYKNLYEKCWDGNPELRPTMESVLETLSLLQERMLTLK